MKGLFITVEGGDGAGKSTQINNINSYFVDRGYDVVHSREPGGTRISEELRSIVLSKEYAEMECETEMLIYAAARAQHVREFILPALASGKVVICDRYVDSSIAYQGYGRELGEIVRIVNEFAIDGRMPDITFWLDIDPKEGKARASKTGDLDRLEREELDFHYKTREGFRRISEADADRVKRVDAAKTPEEIKEEIFRHLDNLLRYKDMR